MTGSRKWVRRFLSGTANPVMGRRDWQGPNPGSDDGTVPALNPIDPALSDKKAPVFAGRSTGICSTAPCLMAAPGSLYAGLGDSKTLSQKRSHL